MNFPEICASLKGEPLAAPTARGRSPKPHTRELPRDLCQPQGKAPGLLVRSLRLGTYIQAAELRSHLLFQTSGPGMFRRSARTGMVSTRPRHLTLTIEQHELAIEQTYALARANVFASILTIRTIEQPNSLQLNKRNDYNVYENLVK